MTDERDLPIEGKMIPWRTVFDELHRDAAARLGPGTRYEIRLMGTPPFRRITVFSIRPMNEIEPWTDTPEQTESHYRVGRYTVPEKT